MRLIIFFGTLKKTYHLIPARRPDLFWINQKERICRRVNFAVPVDLWVKMKGSKKINKYFDLDWELKNVKYEDGGETNWRLCLLKSPPKKLEKTLLKITLNYLKSSRPMKRLADTQTPVKDNQLERVLKTFKE